MIVLEWKAKKVTEWLFLRKCGKLTADKLLDHYRKKFKLFEFRIKEEEEQ